MLQGVRSVGFLDHLLTVGTGSGCVHFWDQRAGRYLETPAAELPVASAEPPPAPLTAVRDIDAALGAEAPVGAPAAAPLALAMKGGFLDRNDVFLCVSVARSSCGDPVWPALESCSVMCCL